MYKSPLDSGAGLAGQNIKKTSGQALWESEAPFRIVFRQAWNAMILVDTIDGSCVDANPAFLKMTGYTPADLPNIAIKDIHPPESLPQVMEALRRFSGNEFHWAETLPVLRRDGSVFYADIKGTSFKIKDTYFALWEFRDLTEQRIVEQSLRDSEASFRQLTEDVSDVVWRLDRDHRFTYISPADERLRGYPAEELIGRDVTEVMTEEGLQAHLAKVRQREAAEHAGLRMGTRDYEVEEHCKDGRRVWLAVHAKIDRDDEGQVIGFHGISRDITQRKNDEFALIAAKEAAESANVAKSRFLAATSHDLRQPLTAINLFLDALSRTPMSEEQERCVWRIEDCAKTLNGMLNRLLAIARLDSGAIKASLSTVPASDLFYWMESEFSTLFLNKGLRFKFHFPIQEIPMLTDAELLKSMLRNVLYNAHKYCESGGVLAGIRRRGKRALIQIWDTGIGIPPEHIDKIFEEYYQIGNMERNPDKGVGLGLSVVLLQAKLIGAEVKCRSRDGKGSVFEITLPLSEN